MSSDSQRNPFQPGTGSFPPVLAGREEEKAQLEGLLKALAAGDLAQNIHLVQAPRGMGKTVLLRDIEWHAPADVAVLAVAASYLPTLAETARIIAPPMPWWRRLLRWLGSWRMGGVEVRPPDASPASDAEALDDALMRRGKNPFLFVIDEAHALDPTVASILLNRFQVAAGRRPCALLLAGTPALKPFLLSDEVNASFVERTPMVVPGLFSDDQCREALGVPQWRDWQVEAGVLDEVVKDSIGYPYFVQLWGKALWDAGVARRTLDRQVLEDARSRVDAVRGGFCADRFDEFERDAGKVGVDRKAMLGAVQRVAANVRSRTASLSTRYLDGLLEAAGLDAGGVVAAKRVMVENGFLTREAGDWRAGIPSLATYICDNPRV